MYDSCNHIIKIAHITKDLPANGISNVVLNYTCNLDKSRFKTVIIAGSPVLDIYKEKCQLTGVEIKEIPAKKVSPISYYLAIWKILNEGKYDIVHVHGNSATISIELFIAWMTRINIRIAHCHSCKCDSIKVHKFLLPFFKHLYTKGYACSDLAGKWLFENGSYKVIPNGFDISKFVFDKQERETFRRKLGLDNKFVIGNVARFNEGKNHVFLLDVFEKVASQNDDAVLLLAGNGPLLDKIQMLIERHPYKDRIIYYGVTDHVELLYDAMDVFVLPSKFEGLGIVFIEAQINGLHCITSNRVPKEVNINNNTAFLSLDNPDIWAEEISKVDQGNREFLSKNNYIAAQNYDIDNCVKLLQRDYVDLFK